MPADTYAPLAGVRVVSLAPNLPGPAAVARLRTLGASVTKVEGPAGDLLAHAAPTYYRELLDGIDVVALDLKDDVDRDAVRELLADAHLLVTSSRPSALAKLGLSWDALHAAFPQLSQVAIVGHAGADAEIPGHDLTYQAVNGMLTPPEMPRALVADLAGAERAATEAVAALWQADRTGEGVYREVALADAAAAVAAPVRHGMTGEGALLGGALPNYRLYESSDGYIALAALEPHFWRSFLQHTGVADSADAVEELMRTRTCAEWEAWAAERDIPLAAVRS